MFWKKKEKKIINKEPISENQKNKIFPEFKYHKDVLETEVVVKETITCECCNQQSEYRYDGPIYGVKRIENLCPWCIAEGRASKELGLSFNDGTDGSKISREKLEILYSKTPGYISWQASIWPIHCDDVCSFVNYVGIKEIKKLGLKESLESEFIRLAQEFSMYVDEFKNCLINDGDMQAYLFKCIHCGEYKLYVDLS